MTTIHLLIEDDYVETFMDALPKDKITVIEEDFKKNQEKLQKVLDSYENHNSSFTPYNDSMKNLSIWIKEKEV